MLSTEDRIMIKSRKRDLIIITDSFRGFLLLFACVEIQCISCCCFVRQFGMMAEQEMTGLLAPLSKRPVVV